MYNVSPYDPTEAMDSTPSQWYQPNIIENNNGIGLYMKNSYVSLSDTIDISNCSSHAIELDNSRIDFLGATTGSGNTGAGLYGHSGSKVLITDGSPPTLTGTVGEISSDGITEMAQWSDVDGGNEYRLANTLTVKEQ